MTSQFVFIKSKTPDALTMKWKAYLPEDMEIVEDEEAIIHQMKRKRKIDRYEI